MKAILTTLVFLLSLQLLSAESCGTSGYGQCNSPDTLGKPGFDHGYLTLPPLINGIPVDITIQFRVADSEDIVTYNFDRTLIKNYHIDSITNLPNGLCWSSNNAKDTFTAPSYGCIRISGTPCTEPGQYLLMPWIVVLDEYGGYDYLVPDTSNLRYILRVKNYSDTTVPLNALQSHDTVFVLYGDTANCSGVPLLVSLGPDTSINICEGSHVILNPVITYGTPPFVYAWQQTGSALSCDSCPNPQVTITTNSTYILHITDARDSSATDTIRYVLNGDTSSLTPAIHNTNIGCSSLGDTTSIYFAGGTHPWLVTWGDGTGQTISTSDTIVHDYSTAGVYLFTMTTATGCVVTAYDTISNDSLTIGLAYASTLSCGSSDSGVIAVHVTGGTLPYYYYWSNSSNNDTISGVSAGTYSLTVYDAGGCTGNFTYTLNASHDNGGFYAYLNITNSNCGSTGAIADTLYGGTSPFSYLWSNSSTTQNISGIASGTYTLTVTDSVGCQTTAQAFISTSCTSWIFGAAFVDSNNNCLFDSTDVAIQNITILASAANGDVYFGETDQYGNYYISVDDTGTFNLYTAIYGFSCGNLLLCNNLTQTVYLPVLGDTVTSENFALHGSEGFDLSMYIGWSAANPGFQKNYWINPYNTSPVPFNGTPTVIFGFDPRIIYQFSLPPYPVYDSIAHTLTWTLDSVGSVDSASQILNSYFLVPDTIQLDDTTFLFLGDTIITPLLITSNFVITPYSGDCNPTNNSFSFTDSINDSHDPNEKDVTPAGAITASDTVLTYTIHFQNTGTDSTHFIVVVDTLPPNLDASTVRNLAASYKYSNFNISGKGILTWTFNPYRLPDSSTNASASKGFVMFSVKTKGTLPIGTSISNTASIYFDYNAPVQTNAAADTVANPNGIRSITNAAISVKAYPNPFDDVTEIDVTGMRDKFNFELYDLTGRREMDIAAVGETPFQLFRGKLASGVYLYRIVVSGNAEAFGKLAVQ